MQVFVTVLSGVFVYTIGQIILKFAIEPIHELKEEISKLEHSFLRYSTSRSGFSLDEERRNELKAHCALILVCKGKVPFLEKLHCLYGLPSKDDIELGCICLQKSIYKIEFAAEEAIAAGESRVDFNSDEELSHLLYRVASSLGIHITFDKLIKKATK